MSREPRHRARLAACVLAAALAFSATAVCAAERLTVQNVQTASFPDVTLNVGLPASVIDAAGSGEPTFRITENGIEVPVSAVRRADGDRRPADVVLLIDASGSMAGSPITDAQSAALEFIAAMGATDRIALVSFDTEPTVLSEFTSHPGTLRTAVGTLRARGETALYDGLVRASALFAESAGRDRYIIVLSDGGDTQSLNSLDSAAAAVGESGAPVYAVALESPEYNPASLKTLAERSGGRLSTAADSSAFTQIFAGIASELASRYLITFKSQAPNTVDLELAIVARGGEGGVSATATHVLANPGFAAAKAADLPASGPAQPLVFPVWPPLAILAMVFGAAFLMVVAVGVLFARDRTALEQLKYYEQFHERDSDTDDLRNAAAGGLGAKMRETLEAVADQRGLTGFVRLHLERAGWPLRPNEYIYFHVLITSLAGVLFWVTTGSMLLAVIAIMLVVLVPLLVVSSASTRRTARFEAQLPDILSMIAGSLRTGWGVQQAIDLVVQEVGEPASSEFSRVQAEARLGMPLEQSLGRMAERLDSDDYRWTVAAIGIQRDIGGNLAEVLDIVAGTIRERAELKRHVTSLTAESRFSAVVLVALPFFLLIAMWFVGRQYISALVTNPIGWLAMGTGLLLLLIGAFWLMRLTKVDI